MTEPLSKISFALPPNFGDYYYWIQVNKYNKNQEIYYTHLLDNTAHSKPLISVIIPVYNTNVFLLEKTLQSVIGQIYTNWEIILIDDGSTNRDLLLYLDTILDARITIRHTANGGISHATNLGVSLAKGLYIAFLDHDDIIEPNALAEIVLSYNKNNTTDIFYTDDDKIDNLGRRYSPQFKPQFSPEHLLSHMYMGHLIVVKRELFNEVGGFYTEFDGAQDYHFILNCLLKYDNNLIVTHIPKILYHWRASENSLAASSDAKPESIATGRRALQEYINAKCKKENIPYVHCEQYPWAELSKCGYYKLSFTDVGPSVTIIIPIKDRVDLLSVCVDSIVKNTSYTNYKILIIDNGSIEKKTMNYLNKTSNKFSYITIKTEAFNFALINNFAVKHVEDEYILFLNSDTKILNKEWLSNLMGYAQFSDVGAVGARLLYPDGTIQHAGIVTGLNTVEGNIVKPLLQGELSSGGTYLSSERLVRNTSAVTAACLLTKKSIFTSVGGFDQDNFKVAYNDPDFCFKVISLGKRIVYCPDTHIIHYEGKTRDKSRSVDDQLDHIRYKLKYKHKKDLYYNSNLDTYYSNYKMDGKVVLLHEDAPSFKVAAFSYNLNYEGSSFSQFELISGVKQKSSINFIVYSSQDGPLRKMYEDKGIQVKIFPSVFSGGYNYYVYKEGVKRLKEDIIKECVNVIYANTLQTFYAIDVAHELLIPSLWNIRESELIDTYFSHFGQQIAFKALECFFYSYKNIFVSHSSRRGCEKFNCKNNFHVIHNGLNIDRFNPSAPTGGGRQVSFYSDLKSSDTVYINVGTICERKNQIETLHALSLMREQEIAGVKVIFVGLRSTIPYYTQFMKVFANLPEFVKKNIFLVDETDDLVKYYTLSHVFISNTLMESYPRVILEALHFNLGIITTPVNGIVEQVTSLTSDFYTPGDIVELKNAILRFKEKEYRKSKSDNCKYQLASLTSYEQMVDQYKMLFIEAFVSGVSR